MHLARSLLAVFALSGAASTAFASSWEWPSKELQVVTPVDVVVPILKAQSSVGPRGKFETTDEHSKRWRSFVYEEGKPATFGDKVLVQLALTEGKEPGGDCTKSYDANAARYALACASVGTEFFGRWIRDQEGGFTQAQLLDTAVGYEFEPSTKGGPRRIRMAGIGSTDGAWFSARNSTWHIRVPPRVASKVDSDLKLYAVFSASHPLIASRHVERVRRSATLKRDVPVEIGLHVLFGDVHELWLVTPENGKVVARIDVKARLVEVNPNFSE
jgi:hypothetical protein